jgi:hypothetical protein
MVGELKIGKYLSAEPSSKKCAEVEEGSLVRFDRLGRRVSPDGNALHAIPNPTIDKP